MSPHRRTLLVVSGIVLGSFALGAAVALTRQHWARLFVVQTIVLQIDAEHPYDETLPPALAIARTAETVRARAEEISSLALVQARGSELRVALPRMDPRTLQHVEGTLTRSGRLEFKLVDDDSEYMREIAKDAATSVAGVAIGHDGWIEQDSGKPHSDLYLRAVDPNALFAAWHDLLIRHPLPADREIAFEHRLGGEAEGDSVWRSYYLVRHTDVTGDDIRDAEQGWDERAGRPEINVRFDEQGARRFEALSAGAIGRKVAILLEGRVNSAPVIEARIPGGRARITIGGAGDPFQAQQEAKDLVAVLRAGSLAAPVRVVRVENNR
jgi:preprotein translocase subunit SecD